MGRISTYTPEVGAKIAARLSTGEPLTIICADEGMPCDDTVRNWAEADAEFGRVIARAREAGFDRIALDALAIADETEFDTKTGPNGADVCDGEWISRSKLRVETRLKLLAKWSPQRYGDMIKLGDPDGKRLAEVDPRTEEERARALALLVARGLREGS